MEIQVSFGLAFLAGVVSFLSPCILPVVPSYLAFISGLTLDELSDGTATSARKAAALNSILFVLGFAAVFMTMGFVATAAGQAVGRALPLVNRAGGVIIILFGLQVTGLVRLPGLAREARVHLSSKPAGTVGSLLVGVAFGAGWTPCIGPILASILFYAGFEATMVEGTLLLATYALGLGIPFVLASVGFNWFLAGAGNLRAWMVPLERVAGTVLIGIGLLMVTGRFAILTAFLADLGQLINLEMP